MGENISHDPELNSFLGLETNGIFYEQIEELSEKLWNIGNSRLGSWYVDKMPNPISLATFNPTQKWIKNKVHVPFLENNLPPKYYYQLAYPDDNAFVTNEQKEGWEQLDERYKRQFILGDWTNFDHDGSRWAYAFDENKHCVNEMEFNPNREICISFDFNKNPMSCIIFQSNGINSLHIYDAIKLPNSDIYQMCEYINAHYPNKVFLVTGDASGNSGSAMVKDNQTYYKIIQKELRLGRNQLLVPTINPPLEKNRVLFNSILSRGDFKMLRNKTLGLKFDLENATLRADGSLKKQDRNDPAQQLDLLDCARYAANTFLSNFTIIN
jgi:phage terminase large subunit